MSNVRRIMILYSMLEIILYNYEEDCFASQTAVILNENYVHVTHVLSNG
jgi:hypothetical protein